MKKLRGGGKQIIKETSPQRNCYLPFPLTRTLYHKEIDLYTPETPNFQTYFFVQNRPILDTIFYIKIKILKINTYIYQRLLRFFIIILMRLCVRIYEFYYNLSVTKFRLCEIT